MSVYNCFKLTSEFLKALGDTIISWFFASMALASSQVPQTDFHSNLFSWQPSVSIEYHCS